MTDPRRYDPWKGELDSGRPGAVGYKKYIVAKTYAYGIWSTKGNLQHTKDIKIIDGRWHHLAVTYARGDKTFYLDGHEIHSEKGGFLRHHTMGVGLGVGGGGYGQPRFFGGAVDEFMLFDRMLSAEEVESLARTGQL